MPKLKGSDIIRENYFDKISIEDLQLQHQAYAKVIGIENLIKLSQKFGGTQIYIPKPDELVREYKYKKIEEEYDGRNITKLAIKYDLSERTIYKIVEDKRKKIKVSPYEGQISFFNQT